MVNVVDFFRAGNDGSAIASGFAQRGFICIIMSVLNVDSARKLPALVVSDKKNNDKQQVMDIPKG